MLQSSPSSAALRDQTAKHRVLLVDDHEIVRQGLRFVLADQYQFEIVGDAADGVSACAQASVLRPDLVVMDLSLPGMNGTEATKHILATSPACRVVVLSAYAELAYVRETFAAGARGYVLKRALLENLLRALEVVASGGIFLDPALVSSFRSATTATPMSAAVDLTAREIDVGTLGARGHTNAEIAATLGIAIKTVETHKTRLLAKLGISTRVQFIQYALHRGWLS